MKIELPELPYGLHALEPYMTARTLEFHYRKHHQAYVTNLNSLISKTKYKNEGLEAILTKAEGAIFHNAAQVWNHTFFFNSLKSSGNHDPYGHVSYEIQSSFGSYIEFKDAFIKNALKLFGSGWIWLIIDSKGKLDILPENNAGNPLRKGLIPILTCDLWEHAYYLEYQNRKIDYLNAFWNIIDWEVIETRYNDEMSIKSYNNIETSSYEKNGNVEE
jgi:Fe-Mn family superoxide dismutase